MLPILVAWLVYLVAGTVIFFAVARLVLFINRQAEYSTQSTDESYTKTQEILLLVLAMILLVLTVLLAARSPQVGVWITSQYEFWRRVGTWLLAYVTLTTVPFSIFMVGCLICSTKTYLPDQDYPTASCRKNGIALLLPFVAIALIIATVVTVLAPLPW